MQAVRQRIDIEHQRIDIDRAFVGFVEREAGAIIVAPDSFLASDLRRSRAVVEFASHYEMPAVYGVQFFPRIGGLMSYSVDPKGVWHQLGTQYVARILKGTEPADLPVQQPNTFSLAINLKTAKALGLEVPLSIRLRADEVIGWDGGSSLQG